MILFLHLCVHLPFTCRYTVALLHKSNWKGEVFVSKQNDLTTYSVVVLDVVWIPLSEMLFYKQAIRRLACGLEKVDPWLQEVFVGCNSSLSIF